MIALATLCAPFGFLAISTCRAAIETRAIALASTEATPLKSRVIPLPASVEFSGATVRAGRLFGTVTNW